MMRERSQIPFVVNADNGSSEGLREAVNLKLRGRVSINVQRRSMRRVGISYPVHMPLTNTQRSFLCCSARVFVPSSIFGRMRGGPCMGKVMR